MEYGNASQQPSTSQERKEVSLVSSLRNMQTRTGTVRYTKDSFLDYRLRNLYLAGRHKIGFRKSTAVTCLSLDKKENAFLLCGGADGAVALTNLVSRDFGTRNEVVIPKKLNHKFMVTDCQWFWNDIRLFVTSSMDKTVKLWDLSRLCHLDTFRYTDNPPIQLHWNEHNQKNPLLAVANYTSNVSLIDVRSGTKQEIFTRKPPCCSVRWIPSDKQLLTVGSADGTISVYDVRSARGALIHIAGLPVAIAAIRCTPCGQRLIVAGQNMQLKVYDANDLRLLSDVKLTNDPLDISHVSFKPLRMDICTEGNCLRVAIPYQQKVIWAEIRENSSPNPRVSFLTGHFQNVNTVLYRPEKQQLLTAGSDQSILCWAPLGEKPFMEKDTVRRQEEARQDTWSDED